MSKKTREHRADEEILRPSRASLFFRLPARSRHAVLFWSVAILLIVLVETFFFNLNFWKSLSAEPAATSATVTTTAAMTVTTQVGPGLSEVTPPTPSTPTSPSSLASLPASSSASSSRVYQVTDSAQATITQSGLDGTVQFIKITPGNGSTPDAPKTTSATGTTNSDANSDINAPIDAPIDDSEPQFFSWMSVVVEAQPADSNEWKTGSAQWYDQDSPTSQYLVNDAYSGPVSAIRLRYQLSNGAMFAFQSITAGARVPFHASAIRIALMLLIALFIFFFRPSSKLYKIPLFDSVRSSVRGEGPHPLPKGMRIAKRLAPIVLALGIVVGTFLAMQSLGASYQGIWRYTASYTINFEQYNSYASAILHGSPWLNLPVPQGLAAATDPYSTQVQDQLLQQGTNPIYWDHVFFNGHWYTYFGVLPALLIFVPFQAIAGLFGAHLILPTAAVTVGVALFAVLALCYLVIRVIHRYFPRTSLGMELLCMLGAVGAANIPFLFFKPDFYTLPMSASLLLTFWGLWFWLGAKKPAAITDADTAHTTASVAHVTGSVNVWKVALGSLLIAANIGCRPTFLIAALLAFPIFWDEIRQGVFFSCLQIKNWRKRKAAVTNVNPPRIFRSLRADCAAIVPAITVIIPILWFNFWRFGNWLDFGNSYQITVNDMQTYRTPLSQLPLTVWYYLAQPLRFTGAFPFIGLAPTPFPATAASTGVPGSHIQTVWTEPQIGGYLALAPFALLLVAAIVFLFPRLLRRKARAHQSPESPNINGSYDAYDVSGTNYRGIRRLTVSALVLGIFLCLFDAYEAGLSWRYMTDFAWLFMLLAVFGACWLETSVPSSLPNGSQLSSPLACIMETASSAKNATSIGVGIGVGVTRTVIAVLVGLTLIIVGLALFVPGRYNDLLTIAPTLFFDARSSFSALL